MFAKQVMDKRFHFLHPKQSVVEAIRLFKTAGEKEGKKVFGMMVIDDDDRLVGMLSMFDILLYIQPKHIGILGEMEDISPEPLFESLLSRIKKIRVEDLMSTTLVSVKPDTHLLVVMDIMIRKHVRRLPVVENNRVIGILYRSDLFHLLMGKLIDDGNS
ncbi:MAG: CBS domain-containing protein [Proteobacteria bacterium]|nr:CBS domain-containing protein [Pseudomonadota bacterium]MBU1585526.1 CBS domain-containing protein [Pseudomonadota bacterium]MBU2630032.1 CBS domain-containing protein [Pseudomonadota bacterium]